MPVEHCWNQFLACSRPSTRTWRQVVRDIAAIQNGSLVKGLRADRRPVANRDAETIDGIPYCLSAMIAAGGRRRRGKLAQALHLRDPVGIDAAENEEYYMMMARIVPAGMTFILMIVGLLLFTSLIGIIAGTFCQRLRARLE